MLIIYGQGGYWVYIYGRCFWAWRWLLLVYIISHWGLWWQLLFLLCRHLCMVILEQFFLALGHGASGHSNLELGVLGRCFSCNLFAWSWADQSWAGAHGHCIGSNFADIYAGDFVKSAITEWQCLGICILFSGYFDAIRLAAIKVIDFYCECTLGITQHPWTFSWLQRNRFGGLPRVDCVGRLFAFIYDTVCVSDCDLGAGRRGEEQGVIGRCYALICQGVPKGYRV